MNLFEPIFFTSHVFSNIVSDLIRTVMAAPIELEGPPSNFRSAIWKHFGFTKLLYPFVVDHFPNSCLICILWYKTYRDTYRNASRISQYVSFAKNVYRYTPRRNVQTNQSLDRIILSFRKGISIFYVHFSH